MRQVASLQFRGVELAPDRFGLPSWTPRGSSSSSSEESEKDEEDGVQGSLGFSAQKMCGIGFKVPGLLRIPRFSR